MNNAVSVCAGLVSWPTARISASALRNVGDFRPGGGPGGTGRCSSAERPGRPFWPARTAGPKVGGVGCQMPGAAGGGV